MVSRDVAQKLHCRKHSKNPGWGTTYRTQSPSEPASLALKLILLRFFLCFHGGSEAGDAGREKQAVQFLPVEVFLLHCNSHPSSVTLENHKVIYIGKDL